MGESSLLERSSLQRAFAPSDDVDLSDSDDTDSSECCSLPSPKFVQKSVTTKASMSRLRLDELTPSTPRILGCEAEPQAIPMSARDTVRGAMSLPESVSWEWPLSRCEKKARVEALERNLWLMDHSELIKENENLREQCRNPE